MVWQLGLKQQLIRYTISNMECLIVAGDYTSALVQSAQQQEADDDHGIMENDFERLTISETAFKLHKHYYYEYENSSYKMVDQDTRDVKAEGIVHVESPGVWLCEVIKGSYENSTVKAKHKGVGLTGSFRVTALPNKKLKLSVAEILHHGKPC